MRIAFLALIALLSSPATAARKQRSGDRAIIPVVDHLVYATPNFERTIDQLEKKLGVRAMPGGSHPGRGTRNALISLGPGRYLEVFSRDPAQPDPPEPRPFGLDRLKKPALVAWLAKGSNLDALRARAAEKGVTLGEVLSGSRVRPDGVQLSWRFTSPWTRIEDGIVPSFIDWGLSPHPSTIAAPGVELLALRAEHPRPAQVRQTLAKLELPLRVNYARHPALVAVLRTPKGIVELR